ncbi:MAG: hypothetical protein WDA20_04650 [Desulfuromonadales bacterium]
MTISKAVAVEQAAGELGTTAVALLMQIKRKHLEGMEIDGAWHLTAESLEKARREGLAATAPMTCQGHCAGGGCAGNK